MNDSLPNLGKYNLKKGLKSLSETMKINGREIFPVGMGTYRMGNHKRDEEQEIQAIRAGLDAGAELIDTAESYGNGKSERLVGKAIEGYDRDSLFLVSKVSPNNASKSQLPISLNRSLKHLGVDYLDLYLLHWQGSVPEQETVDAMEKMRTLGKIKAWGVSNYDTVDMKRLLALPGGEHCQSNQVHYNVEHRGTDFDLMPFMREKNISAMAYSPIIQGHLDSLSIDATKVLNEVAKNHDATLSQILIAWTIRDGNTVSIPKSSNPERMRQNIEAGHIQLTAEDLAIIDQVFPEPTSKQNFSLW